MGYVPILTQTQAILFEKLFIQCKPMYLYPVDEEQNNFSHISFHTHIIKVKPLSTQSA